MIQTVWNYFARELYGSDSQYISIAKTWQLNVNTWRLSDVQVQPVVPCLSADQYAICPPLLAHPSICEFTLFTHAFIALCAERSCQLSRAKWYLRCEDNFSSLATFILYLSKKSFRFYSILFHVLLIKNAERKKERRSHEVEQQLSTFAAARRRAGGKTPRTLNRGGLHVCSGASCYVWEKFSGREQCMTVVVL